MIKLKETENSIVQLIRIMKRLANDLNGMSHTIWPLTFGWPWDDLIIYFSDIESTNDLIETIEYFKRLLEETRVSHINYVMDNDVIFREN